ncbi:glycoside hydrolase domain-containing protein [Actinoplanes ianthinogenes]|nr:glycoside hydrolase domain-containing protein [Actinoplanes ianthinogenes]
MSSPWLKRHRKRLIGGAVVLLSLTPLVFMNTAGAATALPPQPGNFTGYGFDACTAPSSETMDVWLRTSPYRAAGIYIGGVSRGCAQPNLTADWVREQVNRGWRLFPLYVGPQASCTKATKKNLIDNSAAASQGTAAATDAVNQARALGLSQQSVLIYDMEAYDSTDATCKAGVLAFMGAWSARLHDLGYFSGYYSSAGSGIADQVAVYNKPGYVRPDYVDFARWDTKATTSDAVIPSGYWSPNRRMKQFVGGHVETFGGVSINIDSDYLDFRLLPGATRSDWTRNGWSDVVALTKSTGNLFAYPGNGSYVTDSQRMSIAGSKGGMDQLVRMDLNRDGIPDLITRHRKTGAVYLYPGLSNGKLGTRKQLYKDQRKLREFTAIGDFNRDGYQDLLAQQISNGDLYLYPGVKGAKFGTRKIVAYGNWSDRTEFTGAGDFNRDGYQDLVVKEIKTGALYLYRGKSGGFQARVKIGSASGLRDVLGAGDFDRDGYTDLIAVQASTGHLFLARGNGKTLSAWVRISTGYKGRSPLL